MTEPYSSNVDHRFDPERSSLIEQAEIVGVGTPRHFVGKGGRDVVRQMITVQTRGGSHRTFLGEPVQAPHIPMEVGDQVSIAEQVFDRMEDGQPQPGREFRTQMINRLDEPKLYKDRPSWFDDPDGMGVAGTNTVVEATILQHEWIKVTGLNGEEVDAVKVHLRFNCEAFPEGRLRQSFVNRPVREMVVLQDDFTGSVVPSEGDDLTGTRIRINLLHTDGEEVGGNIPADQWTDLEEAEIDNPDYDYPVTGFPNKSTEWLGPAAGR